MNLSNQGLSDLFFRKIGALLLICSILCGCSLIKLKKEVRESMASTVIVGHVSSGISGKKLIVVAAYTKKNGKRKVAHYSILHDCGEYELMVAQGDYYVFAFQDLNRNLIYDAGEPAGQYGEPKVVAAPGGGVVANIKCNAGGTGDLQCRNIVFAGDGGNFFQYLRGDKTAGEVGCNTVGFFISL
jgi:hypothetical protein